jgi:peptidoglycan-N-acetylglucosamine deacetylase
VLARPQPWGARVTPEGAPLPGTVCLTFDFDTMAAWMHMFDRPTPGVLSRGEFGGRVGIWRVLDLLERYSIPATFFTPGYTAETFPEAMQAIAARGHEIGHHGYLHESPTQFLGDPVGERAMYERGLEALDRVVGVRPTGYRSPGWDLTWESVSILLELGFEYDSSMAGDDYRLYFARQGDVPALTGGYHFGAETSLVEVPVSWSWDDFPQFEFVNSPRFSANTLANPGKVFEIWSSDIDYMVHRIPDGVFDLTMHPQSIGRGHRLMLLERFIEHCLTYPSLRFARVRDVVESFRRGHSSATDNRLPTR